MLTCLRFLQHTQQWICSKFSLKTPQHLKCLATVIYDLPLITIPVLNRHLFSDITISQRSVATRLRCGGIFSYHSSSLTVKQLWKPVKIWQSYRHEFRGPVLFGTQCSWSVFATTIECRQAAATCVSVTWQKTWDSKTFTDRYTARTCVEYRCVLKASSRIRRTTRIPLLHYGKLFNLRLSLAPLN